MKALKISLTHGRIWTAETSDGKRATGATLQSALDQLLPVGAEAEIELADDGYDAIRGLFAGIRDSGGDGQFVSGVKSA